MSNEEAQTNAAGGQSVLTVGLCLMDERRKKMRWTVARFPNGNWTTGGKPTDMDYVNCEVFVVEADDRKSAIKKAQAKRSRQRRSDDNEAP